MTRRCLWAANSYWGTPLRVGANHYARRLVERGWEVAFVSEPVSPLHLLRKAGRGEARDRLGDWRGGGAWVDPQSFSKATVTPDPPPSPLPPSGEGEPEGEPDRASRSMGKLFHYSPLTPLPHANVPGLRGRFTLDRWPALTVPNVARKLKREGFGKVDLLVVDAVRQGFWLDAVEHTTSVMRITDRLDAFPAATPAMVAREVELLRRVDHVVYTAQTLGDHVHAAKPQAASYVPNGADVGHFLLTPGAPPPAKPEEYGGIDSPIAVYVGAIASWFDVELLAATAAKLPGVTFVVIGPVDTDVSALTAMSNVKLLGRRPYDALPGYLHHGDVGLIPFRRSALVDGVSPIKLYEYLASGLPVVATRWAELERVRPPAALCDDAAGFVSAVRSALDGPDTHGDRATRIRFARAADWGSRLEMMMDAIGVG